MQQQLHTILCHPERSEGSHNTTNHVTSSSEAYREVKFSNFKILLFSILYSLFSIPTHSQPYQWQWALRGGSNALSWAGASWNCYVEQVHDITIDKNNNYYFVASISTGGTPQLNGQPVTVYGTPFTGNDILLFSTTCNGTLRWSQAIGGGAIMRQLIK